MRKTKKLATCMLASMFLTGNIGLTACGEREDGEKRDSNKIQIECAIQDVGMGTEWLYSLKSRFEADFPKAQIMINIVSTFK